MKNELKIIANIIDDNLENRRAQYTGLTSSEIGQYNQAMMFGENYEAFDEDTFTAFTD